VRWAAPRIILPTDQAPNVAAIEPLP